METVVLQAEFWSLEFKDVGSLHRIVYKSPGLNLCRCPWNIGRVKRHVSRLVFGKQRVHHNASYYRDTLWGWQRLRSLAGAWEVRGALLGTKGGGAPSADGCDALDKQAKGPGKGPGTKLPPVEFTIGLLEAPSAARPIAPSAYTCATHLQNSFNIINVTHSFGHAR